MRFPMRELVKSAASFSLAMAAFGWSRMGRLLSPARGAPLAQEAAAFDRVAQAALAALKPQPPGGAAAPPSGVALATEPPRRVNTGRLNTSRMVVLGEGLAAGMGNFSLSTSSQTMSFP